MESNKFKKEELIIIIIVGLVLGLRQIAVGIVTPFIASYTASLAYGTIALGGITLGITSLSKGIFQVPFGNLGDKIGNKKVMIVGLLILMGGLLIIIVSDNAYIFMVGRALQGAGAIVGAGYTLVANKLGDKRGEGIGLVSVIVGLFSAISSGGGPILKDFLSIKEMYVLSIILVFFGILLLIFFTKNDREHSKKRISIDREKENNSHIDINKQEYKKILLKDKSFIGFLIIAFMTSFVGVAGFFVVPEYLNSIIGQNKMWMVFTPAILLSIVIMKKSNDFVKRGYTKLATILSGAAMVVAIILLFNRTSLILIAVATFLLFTGFNVLTTVIPIIANNMAKIEYRGFVNGIVNTFLFVGNFSGAAILGILWTSYSNEALMLLIISGISIVFIGIKFIKNK